MAFGVSKALKLASFAHWKTFSSINDAHFDKHKTIILVYSLVNSGKSIMEYPLPLRKRCPKIEVVVVAGVVQAKDIEISEEGTLGLALREDPDLPFVTLRKSENKSTAKGTTDTGHQLFDRVYLP